MATTKKIWRRSTKLIAAWSSHQVGAASGQKRLVATGGFSTFVKATQRL
jgi:hypothetical protein